MVASPWCHTVRSPDSFLQPRWPNRCKRSSRTATAVATCRSCWCCPTVAAFRCRRRPRPRSSSARGGRCKALASPELGRLARAYVHNEIDFTGGARRVLDIAEAMVGSVAHGRDRCARGGARSGTSTAATARTSRITTTSPTRSTGCGSIRGWSTRARTSPPRAIRSPTRRRESSTTSAASCGFAPGESLPRHRLRLGRARSSGRRSTTASTRRASRCRSTSSTT